MRKFPRGREFPNEGFVQQAIEAYFLSEGFTLESSRYADLICVDESNQVHWIIEAKGKTAAIGLDFRTGIGQILSRMTDQNVKYALAVPNIPQFATLCNQISGWVRESLNLHWILVGEDSSIHILRPNSR